MTQKLLTDSPADPGREFNAPKRVCVRDISFHKGKFVNQPWISGLFCAISHKQFRGRRRRESRSQHESRVLFCVCVLMATTTTAATHHTCIKKKEGGGDGDGGLRERKVRCDSHDPIKTDRYCLHVGRVCGKTVVVVVEEE